MRRNSNVSLSAVATSLLLITAYGLTTVGSASTPDPRGYISRLLGVPGFCASATACTVDGPASVASFNSIADMAVRGNTLYVLDDTLHAVRAVAGPDERRGEQVGPVWRRRLLDVLQHSDG